MFKDIIHNRKKIKKNEQRVVPCEAVASHLQAEKM